MNYISRYAAFLRKHLDPAKPLKVVFDFSNGPAALVVPKVFKGNKFVVPVYLDRKLSGNFPAHGPNPMVRKAKLHLSHQVIRHNADFGVIFDADGDRAFFVDGRGRAIPPQMMLHLFSIFTPPPFVADEIIYTLLRKEGLLKHETHLSKVGSIFVKRLMKTWRATVGAEYSGHFYFKEFFYVDSGIITAIKGINAISRLPYTLSDYYDFFPKSVEKYRIMKVKNPHAVIESVAKRCQANRWGVNRLDGVLCDGGDAWIHVRASNTEPKIRIFAGGSTSQKMRSALEFLNTK